MAVSSTASKLGWAARCLGLASGVLALSCTGSIDNEASGDQGVLPGEIPGDTTLPEGIAPRPTEPGCELPAPGRAPLRRLTTLEYDNTIRDLLSDDSKPGERWLTADVAGDNADVRVVGSLLAEQYFMAAEEVATRAVGAGLNCDTAALGEEACATQVIQDLGRRAYRRPLPAEDEQYLLTVYQGARQQLDHTESMEVVLATMLQAPRFLYHIETSPTAGVQRLDGYSLASRLSYLFWSTMPDAVLWDAAANGVLDTDAGVVEQARRLLADPRAQDLYPQFFEPWLELEHLDDLKKDETLFPDFNDTLPPLFREETNAFVQSIMDTDGSFVSLLTSSYSMMNGPLAEFYGVTGPTGDAFERVELDPAKSSGLLTHASLLATRAKPHESSPVHRGMFVRAGLLCGTVPPPPDDIEVIPPDPDPSLTTRERFAEHSANAVCGGCHRLLDPLGLGFEHYDATGRWRETENGLPIDDSGELISTDVDGPFNGPRGLADKLVTSPQVQTCFAGHWFRLAQGRRELETDSCSLSRLETAFTDSNLDIRELVLALTQMDAFLYKEFADVTGGAP